MMHRTGRRDWTRCSWRPGNGSGKWLPSQGLSTWAEEEPWACVYAMVNCKNGSIYIGQVGGDGKLRALHKRFLELLTNIPIRYAVHNRVDLIPVKQMTGQVFRDLRLHPCVVAYLETTVRLWENEGQHCQTR